MTDILALHYRQREVFEAVRTRRLGTVLHVTGPAGTGKSHLIDVIRDNIPNVIVACPTGQAATLVRGVTIHKLFGIPVEGCRNSATKIPSQRWREPATRYFGGKRAEPIIYASWIILDECSMIRCDILDFIDGALRYHRKSQEPFGGAGILLVGDNAQLPAIVSEDKFKMINRQFTRVSIGDATILEEYGYEAPFDFTKARVLS